MTSCEKFNHNLTLEVRIVWKISVFNAIDKSIEMLKNSWISSNFNWNKKIVAKNILRALNSEPP